MSSFAPLQYNRSRIVSPPIRPGSVLQPARDAALPAVAPITGHASSEDRHADVGRTTHPGFSIAHLPPPLFHSREKNTTGLPDRLKAGIESLSGLPMDQVQTHYNSPQPARVQAWAYTQGTEIYVGSGQERHLPHEAWHVVQQMQGRVKPTLQAREVAINDDEGLEEEARVMGMKASQLGQVGSPGGDLVEKRGSANYTTPQLRAPGRVLQLARNAQEFFSQYEVTNNISLPFYHETFTEGDKVTVSEAKEGIGVLATVPTHPRGRTIDQIGATYVSGFANPNEAQLRFGLSVGLNAYGGLDKKEEARAEVLKLQEAAQPAFFPRAIIALTWQKSWRDKDTKEDVDPKELVKELADISDEAEKEKVRQRERTSETDQNTFIYGAIREAIIKAEATQKVRKVLLSRPGVKAVYYHIGDEDAPGVRAPETKGQQGVYDVYQQEIRDQAEAKGTVPVLLAGGYRVRREANPTDPGDIPAERFGTELSEFASDVDQRVREAAAEVDPRIPYLSEANLLVSSKDLNKQILEQKPEQAKNPVSGEVFGKTTFESGNLKRFLKVSAFGFGSTEAKQAVGFVPQASLVTGTKGGGDRFIAYHFKKPANYEEVTDETVISEYRKAISSSQNAGSPANLAINLSLFFDGNFGWIVSAGTIVREILKLAQGELGDKNPVFRALSTEPQTRKIVASKEADKYPANAQEMIQVTIRLTVQKVLPVHLKSFEELRQIFSDYLKKQTVHEPKSEETPYVPPISRETPSEPNSKKLKTEESGNANKKET